MRIFKLIAPSKAPSIIPSDNCTVLLQRLLPGGEEEVVADDQHRMINVLLGGPGLGAAGAAGPCTAVRCV